MLVFLGYCLTIPQVVGIFSLPELVQREEKLQKYNRLRHDIKLLI